MLRDLWGGHLFPVLGGPTPKEILLVQRERGLALFLAQKEICAVAKERSAITGWIESTFNEGVVESSIARREGGKRRDVIRPKPSIPSTPAEGVVVRQGKEEEKRSSADQKGIGWPSASTRRRVEKKAMSGSRKEKRKSTFPAKQEGGRPSAKTRWAHLKKEDLVAGRDGFLRSMLGEESRCLPTSMRSIEKSSDRSTSPSKKGKEEKGGEGGWPSISILTKKALGERVLRRKRCPDVKGEGGEP